MTLPGDKRTAKSTRTEKVVPCYKEEFHSKSKRTRRAVKTSDVSENIIEEETFGVILVEEVDLPIPHKIPKDSAVGGKLQNDKDIHNIGEWVAISHDCSIPFPYMFSESLPFPFFSCSGGVTG